MAEKRDAVLREACDHLSNNLKFMLQLKPEQRNAVDYLLKKDDVLAVLPTGYGKSLTFQLFAVAASIEDHTILFSRLRVRFGIAGKPLLWLQSYLSNRTQYVSVDGGTFTKHDLKCGVPQESVLGPILYLLYTSPLSDIVEKFNLSYHFYADDSQLYLSFQPTVLGDRDLAVSSIESCVNEINHWMMVNRLKLKKDKTELLVISAKHLPRPLLHEISVAGEERQTVLIICPLKSITEDQIAKAGSMGIPAASTEDISEDEKRDSDSYMVYTQVSSVKSDLKAFREQIEVHFNRWYEASVELGKDVDVEPALPRIANRQRHHDNAPAATPVQYFQCSPCLPLMDHLIVQMDTYFSEIQMNVYNLMCLVPEVLVSSSDTTIDAAIQFYRDDLVSPDVVDVELVCWRHKWSKVADKSSLPDNASATLV
ncbi:52 kDa repressor of the inhibitor of the protein kinase [Stylophora pistillata]|uniref:52 kDa repressor of the inhibitor of the protein kinase n=1 Tax=Stylophora pistillata TaxID=50429 RepID=A0A2B4RHC5_STYPI|nr:52 kDa repressor of the inhibitor of the protein kinase [Stylophora pistillata]